jgi:hypothetical protein
MKLINIRVSSDILQQGSRLLMRCPHCLREGTLDQRGLDQKMVFQDEQWEPRRWVSAERICPNPSCRGHVFVIYDRNDAEILISYPAERVDFDASDLPAIVREPLEEAIECHANDCYRAAAVMVRRSLEAVCSDQDIDGADLFRRIEGLGQKITLPRGMVESLHNLRLLGNDAAHVESKDYEDVGKAEVDTAIKVTKVVLEATYQMQAILGELEALKREPATD